ncbi:MAG: MarR family winged helix-turn-helix transcriptional regulator [Hyphomonadaceae bacterium]
MAVNLTRSPPEPVGAEARLYLKEDELDRAVEMVFAATRRFWRAAQGPLAARNLGPAHYRAMAAIRRAEGVTVSALRQNLDITKQSLARVLGELEEEGFIERTPGAADRRQRQLRLTEAGRSAEREATAALRERLAQVFRLVGADAVVGARAVLAALSAGTDEP